jgi:hypothetical protein
MSLTKVSYSMIEGAQFNVLDFGAVGDGVTNDTAAFNAAIAAARVSGGTHKPNIVIPAGDYLLSRIELNSVRGLSFTGENTQDPTVIKTRWRYAGGSSDGALVIKSSSYVSFTGIAFDANSQNGLSSLIEFQGNASTAVAPLNRFSSIKTSFTSCIFAVQTGLSSPPTQTIWIKSAGGTNFDRCVIRTGSITSVKLGADSDTDPVTGLATFANGQCTTPYFKECVITGNIQREKSSLLVIDGCDFTPRTDVAGQPSRLTVSGNKVATIESIKNCGFDTIGVTSYSGFLIESGITSSPPTTLTVDNCSLGGAPVLIRCNAGDLTVTNNRGLPFGPISFNKFIQLESGAGSLVAYNNNAEEYTTGANSGGSVDAEFVLDNRTTRKLPVLQNSTLAADTLFTAVADWKAVITAPTYFFGGQYVRISYSLVVKHLDAANPANYGAKVYFDTTPIQTGATTTTLRNLNDFATLSSTFIYFVPAQTSAKSFILQANQFTGVGLGEIQGNSTAKTTFTVELLNF